MVDNGLSDDTSCQSLLNSRGSKAGDDVEGSVLVFDTKFFQKTRKRFEFALGAPNSGKVLDARIDHECM